MKRFIHVFAATLVVLLVGTSARADLVPWTYSWTRDASTNTLADSPGTGGVSLTSETAVLKAAGNSDIVATNLSIFSSAAAETPDLLAKNGHFSLTLTLTDKNSGDVGTATFTGKLSGSFSADSSNVTIAYDTPTKQTLVLGGHNYTVTIGPYSPAGPPSTTSSKGSIGAHVDVDGVSVKDVPEPTTLVLSCLGLTFLGGAAGRKRLLARLRK